MTVSIPANDTWVTNPLSALRRDMTHRNVVYHEVILMVVSVYFSQNSKVVDMLMISHHLMLNIRSTKHSHTKQ